VGEQKVKELYYDINGTRTYPRTLREAFPNTLDEVNPFGKKSQFEIDLDGIFAYLAAFGVGFLFGYIYKNF